MLQESIIEVLSTQMSITCSSLDGEDATADVEEGDIESSTTQIENENILLGLGLTI